MKMINYLDRLFISTSGHSYAAKAGEAVDIRREDVKEALAHGFAPVSNEEYKEFESQPVLEPVEIPIGSDRMAAIIAVLQELRQTNKRFDFTASGFPKKDIVERKLSFELERGELERLWTQLLVKVA